MVSISNSRNIHSYQKIVLTERQICDFELIANGGFAPLRTFMGKKDYSSVVHDMTLANGKIWSIPVVLDISPTLSPKLGDDVLLVDEYNKPLATMTIEETFHLDKELEAKKVYGTTSEEHFGVNYLVHHTNEMCISGPLEIIDLPDHHDFEDLRLSPLTLKSHLKQIGAKNIVAFQTRNPIHAAHYSMIRRAAVDANAHILIHPVVGQTKTGDIDYITRVKSYKALVENHFSTNEATLSLLPIAMRMAGPREALWHAIIRKNYGATHFIVGRDHAGPGRDKKGKQFYHPLAAQELAKKYEKELGIKILAFEEMVYVKNRHEYIPKNEVIKSDQTLSISGTEFRHMLMHGKRIPKWFSFPEVIKVLRAGLKREMKTGLVIFFTGLPSSGKSTLARMLYHKILEHTHRSVSLLDGDVIRHHISKGLGFSKEDRNENIKRIGFIASEIAKHGGIAICAAIAPYEESRSANRRLISKYGKYIEVYVSTPIEECMKRDVKGLYEAHKNKNFKNLTGKDDPYEIPSNPEIILDTSDSSVAESLNYIYDQLNRFTHL